MDFKETDYINRLYDVYAPLLTEHQQKVMQAYYQDDLSLSEISENLSISRNAVFTVLKRTVKILEEYESKLKLVEKIDRIYKVLETNEDNLKDKIEKIIED